MRQLANPTKAKPESEFQITGNVAPLVKPQYERLEDIVLQQVHLLKPPERLTVTEAAEKYVRVHNPGSYSGPYKRDVVPYMTEPTDELENPNLSSVILVGPAQSGKALAIDTPIATPNGWSTMGELRVGDTVFDEYGNPCNVVFATEVMYDHPCYEVCFDDGTSIVADAEHRWFVRDDVREKSRVVTTEEMVGSVKYGNRKHRNRYAITNAKALVLPKIKLPIDPYTLGVWIGDGGAGHTTLYLNAGDTSEIVSRIEDAGYISTVEQQGESYCNIVRLDSILTHGLRHDLHDLNLLSSRSYRPGKFIPPIYLRASEYQRMELLRGILDTDGYVEKNGRIEISTVSQRLRTDLCELIASLGFKPSVSEFYPTFRYKGEKRTGQLTYCINFFAYRDNPPFHLQRHVDRLKSREMGRPTYPGSRRIVEIKPVTSVPVCCIQVDSPNHLYLAGSQMVPTHNTQSLIINWLAYSVKCSPMDMMVVSPSQAASRDFSIRRLDRLNRHSPEIGAMLSKNRDADNKFDKIYGPMLLTLAHPSATELAGKPIPHIALTDYDRMVEDVDGEGAPFDLAQKRTTTFGSFAMTLAESSPSRDLTDPRWIARTPHEAPPTTGILALYNRGDRRRFYWPCPHCGNYFEGEFSMLEWDTKEDAASSAETVRMRCPKCSEAIHFDQRHDMLLRGVWLKDGEAIDKHGVKYGTPIKSSTASFWLKGVAAAFVTWKKLVETYLTVKRDYELTGSSDSLRKFHNTDLAEVFIPPDLMNSRTPEELKSRAERFGDEEERLVPEGARFLTAQVDVQKNAFIVQVHAISPGTPFDITIVDRFSIFKSTRTDADGDTLWVKPGSHLDDWELLVSQVMEREYPLQVDKTRVMGIKLTLCDSGGAEGVTSMAYDFYRSLRSRNLHGRFHLVKGDASPTTSMTQPRVRITYPDAQRKDKLSAARGDVPVLLLNSNMLKDALNHRLDCLSPGKGLIRFPDWLPDWFFKELTAEQRQPKGWVNPGYRNEAWDLLYYCIGGCASKLLNVEHLDWDNPPGWASAELDKNPMVRQWDAAAPALTKSEETRYDFKNFAEKLAS